MGSAIIEVGIGLVLVYLVLSIVITQVNNVIVNVLNLRAENLRSELEKLLSDEDLSGKLLTHPLVNLIHNQVMLIKRPGRLARLRQWLRKLIVNFLIPGSRQSINTMGDTTGVSWIDPEVFADALIDLVITDKEVQRRLDELAPHEAVQVLSTYIQEKVTDTNLERTLDTMITAAKNLDDARAKIGAWFNNGMVQAGTAFKGRVQFVSFTMALLLAVIFNVDTLHLAETFWNDSALRQTIVAVAEQTIQDTDFVADSSANSGDIQQETQQVQQTIDYLFGLRAPMGWVYTFPAAGATQAQIDQAISPLNLWAILPGSHANWMGMLLAKLIGLLATTFAIMQGSDFWFNLLRNLTAARSSASSSASQPAAGTSAG